MAVSGTHGLTLGKFAPLHAGHQLVIETALAEVDSLSVIIYDSPATTNVPLAVRAGWIRCLYPGVNVIEAWDGPEAVGYDAALMRAHEHYIIDVLGITGVTHFYSSEPYGEHMSRALRALDRQVDPKRQHVPVSGTAIRDDPYAHRQYLSPLVYADLILNVVFMGAPSTGKTTLARHLAQRHDTVWMPEYGREYWQQRQVGRRLEPAQLVEIAQGHLERENALLRQADRVLFTDTNAITTLTFARQYHGVVDPRLEALADQAARRYDLTFLCETDIEFEDTWERSGAGARDAFQRQVIADLAQRRVPFIRLAGTVAQRAARVEAVLAAHRKFDNVVETLDHLEKSNAWNC